MAKRKISSTESKLFAIIFAMVADSDVKAYFEKEYHGFIQTICDLYRDSEVDTMEGVPADAMLYLDKNLIKAMYNELEMFY